MTTASDDGESRQPRKRDLDCPFAAGSTVQDGTFNTWNKRACIHLLVNNRVISECHVRNGEQCFLTTLYSSLTFSPDIVWRSCHFPVRLRPERAPSPPAPQLLAFRQIPKGTVPQVHRWMFRQCKGYEVRLVLNSYHFLAGSPQSR